MTEQEKWQKMPDDDVKFTVHATPAPTEDEPDRYSVAAGLHGSGKALTKMLVRAMDIDEGIRKMMLSAVRDYMLKVIKDKPLKRE